MGWHITEFENNTLKVSKDVAKKVYKAASYGDGTSDTFRGPDEVIDKSGFLVFDSDAMEHMDYLSNSDEIVKVLRKAKVKGRILFCSHEGDNAGEYWGHEFDGKGGYHTLRGEPGSIVWKRG